MSKNCPILITTSISSAPSAIARDVSATLTSTKVCDDGKPPATEAIFTLAVKDSFTVCTKFGYTQTDATLLMLGFDPSNSFTDFVNCHMCSFESVEFKDVRSIHVYTY